MENRLCKDVENQQSCKIVACDYYDIRMELNCSYSVDNSKCEKENVMKPQFTEEEAIRLHNDCIMDFGVTLKEAFINGLKSCGYIRKSDLEILIEECDTLIKIYHSDNIGPWKRDEIILQQEKLIDLLKAELNKRRDI